MSGLGEQIAVLDGLAAMDPNDGRIGQRRARVTQYSTPVMPGVTARRNVIDASAGANYSGGSSYAPGLPLLPSTVGLAAVPWTEMLPGRGRPYFGRQPGMGTIPNVLPLRQHVIDYSGGANYSGGSDWVPGLPLLPSSAGLADSFIRGGYGRAGLGASFIQGGYGRAGLGQTASAVDEDLAAAMEAVETAKAYSPSETDGRIGQRRAMVDEYGRKVMPGVLERSNVIDPSEGANYSGGSDYYPGGPLLPSSVGLAGFSAYDDLDGLSDKEVGLPAAVRKLAGRNVVKSVKNRAKAIAKRINNMSPRQRARAAVKLQQMGAKLVVARRVRRAAYANKYAQRAPLWAR